MNRCSPATAQHHMRICAQVLAHGYTPELRSSAEMYCLGTHDRVQPELFTAPPTRESCPGDQLSLPAGGAALVGL